MEKRKKIKFRGMGMKEARKQAKQGGKKPKNKEKKPNGGERRRKQKWCFH
jgi:hypothetical protein